MYSQCIKIVPESLPFSAKAMYVPVTKIWPFY